jgi:ribosomal protein S27E
MLTQTKYPPTVASEITVILNKPTGEWDPIAQIPLFYSGGGSFPEMRQHALNQAAALGANCLFVQKEEIENVSVSYGGSYFTTRNKSGVYEYDQHYQVHSGGTRTTQKLEGVYFAVRITDGKDLGTPGEITCPYCKAQMTWPSNSEGVFSCRSCKDYQTIIRCSSCAQWNVLLYPFPFSCSHCGKDQAAVRCRHCRVLQTADQYDGRHACLLCKSDFYSILCPHCKEPMTWGSYEETIECSGCARTIPMPK